MLSVLNVALLSSNVVKVLSTTMAKTRDLMKREEGSTLADGVRSGSATGPGANVAGISKMSKSTKHLSKFKNKAPKVATWAIDDRSDKSETKRKRDIMLENFRYCLFPEETVIVKEQAEIPAASLAKDIVLNSKASQRKVNVTLPEGGILMKSRESGNIPLAVVMPGTALPPRIDSAADNRGADSSLENKTMLEVDMSGISNQNESNENMPISYPLTLHKNKTLAHEIPLVVSMPDQLAVLVNSAKFVTRDRSEEVRSTENECYLSTSDNIMPQNLGNDVPKKDEGHDGNESYISGDKPNISESNILPSNSSKMFNKMTAHLFGNSVLLRLYHHVKLYIIGQVHIRVLRGTIQVLGYQMDSDSGSHVLSSLRGSSFLSIEPLPGLKDDIDFVIPPDLQEEPSIQSLLSQAQANETWVVLTKGDLAYLDFMQKYLDYPIYVKDIKVSDSMPFFEVQNKLKCVFQPENNIGKKIFEPKEWNDIAVKLSKEESGFTVICGGKGVGKSTLLRHLVNRALCSKERNVPGVVLFDFDPGQGELTLPGCVTVSVITQPLFGPNYTHLQSSERCIYIGQVDVCQCLERYMEACASLVASFRKSPHLANLPCLVNTMGFTKGIGVTIMSQLLRLLQPTRVVQIQSKRVSNNYPFHLTGSKVVRNLRSLDVRSISKNLHVFSPENGPEIDLNYDFVLLNSSAERRASKNENEWGMRPKMCRDAVVLSYFYQTARAPSYSLWEDVPYVCPLESLFLCVAHEQIPPDFILAAVNGNMVGLCSINPHTENALRSSEPGMPAVLSRVPIAPCLGFGIVRGVDMSSKMLFLTTPLNRNQLSTVNCLVFGAVNLPASVYTKMTAPGAVPYVSSGTHPSISTPV